MKFTTTLVLAVALAATTIAQAGLTRATTTKPARLITQAQVVMPQPIYAQPVVPTIEPIVALPVPKPQPQHLIDGLQLVDEINAAHALGIFVDGDDVAINRYGGSWSGNDQSYIRFMDEDNGVFPGNLTKCAPLVTRLLEYSYDWDWNDYPFFNPKENNAWDDTASPNPWEYLALIEQGKGFAMKVTNIRQSNPGDIISIHYIGETSGHTAILVDLHLEDPMEYPEVGDNLVPQLAGTHFYRMTILDSTQSPHSNDSREFTVVDEDDVETDHEIVGAGTGDMGIFLDINGNIIGHMWSLPNSDFGTQGWLNRIEDDVHLQAERNMVFGRLPANP